MRSLLKFFLLTYLVSWTFFFAAQAISGWSTSAPPGLAVTRYLLFLVGTIAPSIVALALTHRVDGREGTLALLNRVVRWEVAARWYVFALLYMVVIKLGVAVVHRVATGAWPAFGQTPFFIIVAAIVFSTPVQAGEEIGWRGYALPRLAKLCGLPLASIVLGVLWACWHLPFFFIPGSDNAGQSFPVYVLAVTAVSVALAWLYCRTNGSLLLTMLMHAAINNTSGIVVSPISPASSASVVPNPFTLRPPLTAWLTALLLWICSAYCLVRMRGVREIANTVN